tara:strand:- start:33644 stop:34105 length:462 start_codon:yes stop_codon:yes gene_type:complete
MQGENLLDEFGRPRSQRDRTRFDYDVFLSHSHKDVQIVHPLAKRLREDGLKVWLDEWEIELGDSIPEKIGDGLERSRVLLMLLSENFDASDWTRYESGTFLFSDPLNKQRRLLRPETSFRPGLAAAVHHVRILRISGRCLRHAGRPPVLRAGL